LGGFRGDRGASVHYSIRCEAAELALDLACEGDRCAVFEKSANDLDIDRQSMHGAASSGWQPRPAVISLRCGVIADPT
jgi:hypothetical protein